MELSVWDQITYVLRQRNFATFISQTLTTQETNTCIYDRHPKPYTCHWSRSSDKGANEDSESSHGHYHGRLLLLLLRHRTTGGGCISHRAYLCRKNAATLLLLFLTLFPIYSYIIIIHAWFCWNMYIHAGKPDEYDTLVQGDTGHCCERAAPGAGDRC